MEWILLLVVIGGALMLPRLLSSKETKLFRRVWSSELLGGPNGYNAQNSAINELVKSYGINFSISNETLGDQIGRLVGSAAEFDLKHRHNRGIQVTRIIAKWLSERVDGESHGSIRDSLHGMQSYDVIAAHDALNKVMQDAGS